jgi:ADP-ribose pyrophosphatase YjhB (NUDIX family)
VDVKLARAVLDVTVSSGEGSKTTTCGEVEVVLRPLRPALDRTTLACMARAEFFHDAEAPEPTSMRPSAFAATRGEDGGILLVRRLDNGNWELPGGRVEFGESAVAAAVREVREESGVSVKITGLVGVYSDPGHILVHSDSGEVRQEVAICFHALPVDGDPTPDHHETTDATWVGPHELGSMAIHPSVRTRIMHALRGPRATPHFD